ncbi:MAG: hypothetical protein WDM80_16360 [Limisphaerales bacterium]
MKTKKIILCFAMMICVAGCNRWSDKAVKQSKLNGIKVVESLENFNKHNGQFPKSLDELVPKYITSIPEPNRWQQTMGI